jgi:hypothetical protein
MSEIEQLATDVVALVKATKDDCDRRMAALEQSMNERIDAAVRAQIPAWVGAWESGKTFSRNMMVAHDRSSWICLQETSTRPGESSCWALMAGKGKDGKDGGR